MRILIAEDEPLNQRVSRYLMESLGFECDLVANGKDAVKSARMHEGQYDLCLMDVEGMLKEKIWPIALLLLSACSTAVAEHVTYFHNDGLGSPVAATNDRGEVLWTEAYDPYGTRLVKPAAPNRLWYTGKSEESELGLTYFGARWYEPGIGRFHGIDPKEVEPGDVHSFNRYGYANNSPYSYVDPDGRSSVSLRWSEVERTADAMPGVGRSVRIMKWLLVGTVAYEAGSELMENKQGCGTNVSDVPDLPVPEAAPALPGGLVGDQSDSRAGQSRGKRHNSGALLPEHGGTGDAERDFEHLTGGRWNPAPEGSGRPPGSRIGDNGIAIRPGKPGQGSRIDIPGNGNKPPETLHY